MSKYTTANLKIVSTMSTKEAADVMGVPEHIIRNIRRYYGIKAPTPSGAQRKWYADDIAKAMEMMSDTPSNVVAEYFGITNGRLMDMLSRAKRLGFNFYPPRKITD